MAMQGGFSDAPVTDQEVINAAMFAVEAQRTRTPVVNGSAPKQMNLLKILSARQQVVAGVNFALKMEVSLNGEKKVAETVVWWQAWRENPYALISWHWVEPIRQD